MLPATQVRRCGALTPRPSSSHSSCRVPAVFVALLREPLDVVGDLGLQGRRDHPARTLTGEVIERGRDLVAVPDAEPANILHWRAFLPVTTGIGLDQPGRYAAFFSIAVHNFWV